MALTRLGSNNSSNISGINLTSQVTGTLPVANGGTALTSGFVNGAAGISSSATSTLLTLSSDNRLGIDQSSSINQIISASGLNGQATEDWLRIGQTWICAGTWSGAKAVKVVFDLNANTSYVIEINGGGYSSQYHLITGAYRTGTQFQNNLVNDGGTTLTYSSDGDTNTFQTSSQTHGTYMVKLTGNVSGSPLVSLV